MRSLLAARVAAVALVGAVPAAAQVPRVPEGLPPLPETIVLYGERLPTGAPVPLLGPPPGARVLTLEEAVALARVLNPGQEVSDLEALRAATDRTRANAGYAPVVDANVSLLGEQTGFGSDSTGSNGRTTLGANIGGGVTILDGGGRAAAYRRLDADARRFAILADADAEALALAVATAVLDVARQRALADAVEEAVTVSTDRLRLAAAEVRIGTSAEVDAALALSDLNADRARLLRARVALAGARATLGGLLGLPDPDAVDVNEPLVLGPPPDVDSLAAAVVAGNREVRALGVAREAAEAVVDEIRSLYRPNVRATAGLGATAFDGGFLPPAFDPSLTPRLQAGLTLSVPLFDGGERQRQLDVADVRIRQADATRRAALDRARAEAARAAAAVRGQRALAELETGNETVARQNVRVALAQLRLGVITPLDLRQVQLALVDVQARRVEAVFQARLAEFELRLLAGDLLGETRLAP